MADGLPPCDPVIRTVAMPADANAYGDIFGGWLLSLMDLGGGSVAINRARGRVATVAMESVKFHTPVAVGDEVSVYGRLIRTGRTSITVEVEAWRRRRDADAAAKVTQAQFTFVAINDEGRPRPVYG